METKTKRERFSKIIANIFIVWGTISILGATIAYNFIDIFYNSPLRDGLLEVDFEFLTIYDPFQFFYLIPSVIFFAGLLKLVAGLALRTEKIWAEKLSLVLAFFMLFSVPFGTAFAIFIFYTFVDASHSKTHRP